MALEILKFTPRPNGRMFTSQYLLNAGQNYKVATGGDIAILDRCGLMLAEASDGLLKLKSDALDALLKYRNIGFCIPCVVRLTDGAGSMWYCPMEIRKVK